MMWMSKHTNKEGKKVYTKVRRDNISADLTWKDALGVRVFGKYYIPLFFWRRLK